MTDQTDTKERILDAAERLFAEQGFSRPSMRAITTEADVNLAAVNYHFGSKDELIKAVFTRRVVPLNERRLSMLDELEARGFDLENLLDAYVRPVLEMSQDPKRGATFVQLIGRSYTEQVPFLRDHMHKVDRELVSRFKKAFERVLPQLPREELSIRLHFLVGAVSYTMAGPVLIPFMQDKSPESGDMAEALMARLMPFLKAGFEAPLPDDLPAWVSPFNQRRAAI